MRRKLISVGALLATVLLVGFGLVWAQRPAWLPPALRGAGAGSGAGLPAVGSAPPVAGSPEHGADAADGGLGLAGGGRSDRALALPGALRGSESIGGRVVQDAEMREELLALRADLLDPSESVRLQALERLEERSGGPGTAVGDDLARIVRQLALFDPSPQIRAQAATTLSQVAPPDTVAEVVSEAVGDVLDDRGDRTDDERSKTLDALLGLTDTVDPAILIDALHDPALTEAALSFIESMLDSPGSAVISELWAGALDTSNSFDLREAYLDALYQHGEEVDEAYEQLAIEIDQAEAPYWDQKLKERMQRYASRPACQVPGQWRACIWGDL